MGELTSKLKSANIYLTTRGETEELNEVLKNDVKEKADMVNYHSMEVTDIDSIVKFRNMVHAEHGVIDILINNAGQYFAPSEDPVEHMRQVEKTLATNYWGMKNVCKAFLPMLKPAARIVNLSSHLGHLSLIPGENLQRQLGDPSLTETQLDSLILQNQLESEGMESVVVNAIPPGSRHSKISQESPLTPADAAKSVICVALLSDPCDHPRGKFIWHDLQIIQWDQGTLKGMWA